MKTQTAGMQWPLDLDPNAVYNHVNAWSTRNTTNFKVQTYLKIKLEAFNFERPEKRKRNLSAKFFLRVPAYLHPENILKILGHLYFNIA